MSVRSSCRYGTQHCFIKTVSSLRLCSHYVQIHGTITSDRTVMNYIIMASYKPLSHHCYREAGVLGSKSHIKQFTALVKLQNLYLKVRKMYNLITFNCVFSVSYMFGTLNLGSSSGTRYLKSHTSYTNVSLKMNRN
jgi:hypothetical protein